jgi:hypothetical protein
MHMMKVSLLFVNYLSFGLPIFSLSHYPHLLLPSFTHLFTASFSGLRKQAFTISYRVKASMRCKGSPLRCWFAH